MTHDKPAAREWPKRAEMLQNIHDRGTELWNEIAAALDYAYKDGVKDGALRSGEDGPMREAIKTAFHHIDAAMGDTDPTNEDDPLLLAAQALAPFIGDDAPDSCQPWESELLAKTLAAEPPRETGMWSAPEPIRAPSSIDMVPAAETQQQGMVEDLQAWLEQWRKTYVGGGHALPEFPEWLAEDLVRSFPALSHPAVTESLRNALGMGAAEERTVDGEIVKISHDAYHNLGGAIIDIEWRKRDTNGPYVCDRVSLDTLKRVESQLAAVKTLLDELK